MQAVPLKSVLQRYRQERPGVVVVLVAVMLIVLMGLLGLVIDTGLLMAAHRQTQNAADAAALGAAYDKLRGRSDSQALATANSFIQTHNGLANAPALVDDVTFFIPPQSGPYNGNPNYVEVFVSWPTNTIFMHLFGFATTTPRARAVAGFESVSAGEGVIVLRRDANPGLGVSGGGRLRVNGRVVVNSEGGQVDENGIDLSPDFPAADMNSGAVALSVDGTSVDPNEPPPGIYARIVDVVGGANSGGLNLIYGYSPPGQYPPQNEPYPFKARQQPEPDPLIRLPTPTRGGSVDPNSSADTAGGVGPDRGTLQLTASTTGFQTGYTAGANSILTQADIDGGNLPVFLDNNSNDIFTASEANGGAGITWQADDAIIFPGVYEEISINRVGARAFFVPGIYVLSPQANNPVVFSIGGNQQGEVLVVGQGVMFYNTGNNYTPSTGTPDVNDGETPPPGNFNSFEDGTNFVGSLTINKGVVYSPIDTTRFPYSSYFSGAPAVSPRFNGMLFYQRRRNARTFSIGGNATDAELTGTIYAKWALLQLAGQGSYDAQFVIGSLNITGTADLTILGAGSGKGRANQLFLVE